MFHVGQKVVCIRDDWKTHCGEIVPVKGNIYVIREIRMWPRVVCLSFEEIVNAPRSYQEMYGECGFNSRGFRPLIERKTDISIFTEMLTPKKVGMPAGGG